jgi:hypothetical protein
MNSDTLLTVVGCAEMAGHIQLLLRGGRGHGRPTTGRRHAVLQA